MFRWLHEWLISSAHDAGRPVNRWTRQAIERDERLADFERGLQRLGERLSLRDVDLDGLRSDGGKALHDESAWPIARLRLGPLAWPVSLAAALVIAALFAQPTATSRVDRPGASAAIVDLPIDPLAHQPADLELALASLEDHQLHAARREVDDLLADARLVADGMLASVPRNWPNRPLR